jgi:hypothetical protein
MTDLRKVFRCKEVVLCTKKSCKYYSPEAGLKAVDGVLASVEVGAVEVQLTLLTLFLKRWTHKILSSRK